jgi:hypothetical protein
VENKSIKQLKEEWIQALVKVEPRTDREVLKFIAGIRYHAGEKCEDAYHSLFMSGYCYYFALMLKDAFGRGELCYLWDEGHIVWKDENGIAYDYDGGFVTKENLLVPIRYFGDGMYDFRHIPGKSCNASREFIDKCYEKFLQDRENSIEEEL